MSAGIYIEIKPIKGESTDGDHKGWMEALDFSFGVHNASQMGSGQGSAAVNRADFNDFVFTKVMDSASPDLNGFCAAGKKFDQAIVHLCMTLQEKQAVYMQYTFKNVMISSVSVSGAGDVGKPQESISIAFSEVEWKFTAYDHKGRKVADYTKAHNLETNKPT